MKKPILVLIIAAVIVVVAILALKNTSEKTSTLLTIEVSIVL